MVRGMLRLGRTSGCEIVRPAHCGRIWLIGNLELGSEDALDRRRRPFRGGEEMNEALLHGWASVVGSNETVIVAGNAGEGGGIRSGLRDRWLALPGRKLLVIGPQDIGPTGGVDAAAWDSVQLCVITATRPPLAITHLRLDTVPAGCVNLHAGPPVTVTDNGGNRRISIAADRLGFKPAPMEQLQEEAAELILADGTRPRR